MSEYTDQVDSCNAICPYCEEEYQVEAEDYSENSRIEQCDSCGMKYHIHQEFTVDTRTTPDCEINDKKHDLKWTETRSGEAYFCEVCGVCKLPKEVLCEYCGTVEDVHHSASCPNNFKKPQTRRSK